jgi:metal-responsive CopG/Arc/MetJ family transcriptional regulator
MAHWSDELEDQFKTVSASIPANLVPKLDKMRGTKTRSRYIRELIEQEVKNWLDIGDESAA